MPNEQRAAEHEDVIPTGHAQKQAECTATSAAANSNKKIGEKNIMLPSKCEKCGNLIGHFYNMAKGDFSTMKEFLKMLDTKKVSEWSQVWLHKVCPKCKIALEKDGWKVIGNGMH